MKSVGIKLSPEINEQELQDFLDDCVDAGVKAHECVLGVDKRNAYFNSIHIKNWKYAGVEKGGSTLFTNNVDQFSHIVNSIKEAREYLKEQSMNIDNLDFEAAVKELGKHVTTDYNRVTRKVLEAAIPPITDWDGKTPLKPRQRVMCGDSMATTVHHSEISGWVIEYSDTSIAVTHSMNFKPIPQVKKINHSSLVGSDIDVIYDEGEGEYINPYHPAHTQYLKSIRMNKWMVLTDEQVEKLPDGYDYEYRTVTNGYEKPSEQIAVLESMGRKVEVTNNERLVKAVGILKGWEL